MLKRFLRLSIITTLFSMLTVLSSADPIQLKRTSEPSPSLLEGVRAQYLQATRPGGGTDQFNYPGTLGCVVTTIACDTVRSGELGPGDCVSNADTTYLDVWTFQGAIGQTVTVTMRSSSFDSYLFLGDPSGNLVAGDDYSAGGLNARITFTLTSTGEWGIIANQIAPASGFYELSLECTAVVDCIPQLRGTACDVAVVGTIDGTDCQSDGLPFEFWTFSGTAGQNVAVTATKTAGAGNIGLVIFHGDGTPLANDAPDGGTSSLNATLTKAGTWVISVLGTAPISYSMSIGCQTASTCFLGPNSLCLNNSRFRVTVAASDPRTGKTGIGRPVPYNDLTGFFAIPDLTNNPTNLEVFVKILDGRTTNGHYWVFYGGLTDFAYTITIVETTTGATKTYTKPGLQFVGGADTSAF